MGADRNAVRRGKPELAIETLVKTFRRVAVEEPIPVVLATYYAYESQTPAIAQEKARGLLAHYGADADACRYFLVHVTADVEHADVWRGQLECALEHDPETVPDALFAMERASQALWLALDSIEERRQRFFAQPSD